MRAFVDTNLWVYLLDRREPAKAARVSGWLRALAQDNEIVVSTQVLIELRAVLSRKLRPAVPHADIRQTLEALCLFDVVNTDTHLILDAHELAQAEQLSWFDALIVEAALRSRCDVLFSEDLQHGRRFDALEICNPLLDAPSG